MKHEHRVKELEAKTGTRTDPVDVIYLAAMQRDGVRDEPQCALLVGCKQHSLSRAVGETSEAFEARVDAAIAERDTERAAAKAEGSSE